MLNYKIIARRNVILFECPKCESEDVIFYNTSSKCYGCGQDNRVLIHEITNICNFPEKKPIIHFTNYNA